MKDGADRAAQAVRVAAGFAGRMFDRLAQTLAVERRSPPARALAWVRAAERPGGGILAHSGHDTSYQEVSGYLIPTLMDCGAPDLARRLAEWLISVQRADGGFTDPDAGRPHVFDTAQVIRGLLVWADEPPFRDAARRACEFLMGRMIDGGRGGIRPEYDGAIPETVLLYALPPLCDAARRLGHPAWEDAARACLDHALRTEVMERAGDLTHFLGYECEALLALGREDAARPVLERLAREQGEDGGLRGRAEEGWVCTPGLAQIAIGWYGCGLDAAADRAMAWLDARVGRDGEMRGSYGPGASYFPEVSIPWAHKFYLDAHRLRVISWFRRHVEEFPAVIDPADGRVAAVREAIREGDRVLDAGCGRGRFLKALRETGPQARLHGVDISGEMLRDATRHGDVIPGGLERIPHEDDAFDVTFSVEAIEHALSPEAAVAEMTRVTRPGGRVIVIEKQQAHAGRLRTQPWETWPAQDAMRRWLGRGCDEVSAVPVSYDGRPADGLMIAWSGRKRSRLTGLQWNAVLVRDAERDRMLERIRKGITTPWGRALALATAPGEEVLEIGSGTGEISLRLALGGRRVTLLDISQESLDFAAACAERLGVTIATHRGDATGDLPFPDDRFDCVWSSGLLEHFEADERRAMLARWARVCRGRVISLVPNAASVAYRMGKRLQECEGAWPYGLEMPLVSLRDDYEAAGLHVTEESTHGAAHSLEFLPEDHPLRAALETWCVMEGTSSLEAWRQGYLLMTVGHRR